MLDLLVRIEMEPALAALLLWAAVPGDRQRLQPAVGKLDQILLQRVEAERVLDLERGELAVGPIGLDQELPVLAEETRAHAVIVEARVVEIAKHGFVGRVVPSRGLCCEPRHSVCFGWWQPAQVSLPTKVAARVAGDAAERVRATVRRDNSKARADGHDQRRHTDAAMRIVRLDNAAVPPPWPPPPCGTRWRRGARFCDPRFFPELCLERATAVTAHAPDRSLQIVHLFGRGERLVQPRDCRGHRAAWRAPGRVENALRRASAC